MFTSQASNLVPGDTNDTADVFLHDRLTGTTRRVGLAVDGRELAGADSGSISADGRHVVYHGDVPLVSAGTDEDLDGLFVHDVATGRRHRLPGIDGDDPTISAAGRYVAFCSEVRDLVPHDTNRVADCFRYDRERAHVMRVSVSGTGVQANGESSGAVISADGRWVALVSSASNLVRGDTNRAEDVFLIDTRSGRLMRISRTDAGEQADGSSGGAAISADGRYVVYLSQATNLLSGRGARFGRQRVTGVHVYRYDRRTGRVQMVDVNPRDHPAAGEATSPPAMSGDGSHVAFASSAADLIPGDTNARHDVFVRGYPAARTAPFRGGRRG